jgi:hypothetical protein
MRGVEMDPFSNLRFSNLPRALRPRCGATTRAGEPCRAQALTTGFCPTHSGLKPGGAEAEESRERQRERARETMQRRWAEDWAEGRPLSDEARARIAAAQRRRTPESRSVSEATRQKISAARRRAEAEKRGNI